METAFTELEAFRSFLDNQIASGRRDLTPEQSLEMWRESRRQDLEDSVAAVRKALADLDAGETGQPLREFIAEFRTQQQIPVRVESRIACTSSPSKPPVTKPRRRS
jgi:hypothetical protein